MADSATAAQAQVVNWKLLKAAAKSLAVFSGSEDDKHSVDQWYLISQQQWLQQVLRKGPGVALIGCTTFIEYALRGSACNDGRLWMLEFGDDLARQHPNDFTAIERLMAYIWDTYRNDPRYLSRLRRSWQQLLSVTDWKRRHPEESYDGYLCYAVKAYDRSYPRLENSSEAEIMQRRRAFNAVIVEKYPGDLCAYLSSTVANWDALEVTKIKDPIKQYISINAALFPDHPGASTPALPAPPAANAIGGSTNDFEPVGRCPLHPHANHEFSRCSATAEALRELIRNRGGHGAGAGRGGVGRGRGGQGGGLGGGAGRGRGGRGGPGCFRCEDVGHGVSVCPVPQDVARRLATPKIVANPRLDNAAQYGPCVRCGLGHNKRLCPVTATELKSAWTASQGPAATTPGAQVAAVTVFDDDVRMDDASAVFEMAATTTPVVAAAVADVPSPVVPAAAAPSEVQSVSLSQRISAVFVPLESMFARSLSLRQ